MDTLNRALPCPKRRQDMAAYVQAADALRNAFDCAVVIVHHCGHDGARPRGHSSLIGAIDAQIAVKRDAADNIIATLELLKDGHPGDELVSRLEWSRSDETKTTSRSLHASSSRSRDWRHRKKNRKNFRPRLPRRLRRFTRLSTMPELSRRTIPAYRRQRGPVTVEQWRAHAYKRGLCSSGESDNLNIIPARFRLPCRKPPHRSLRALRLAFVRGARWG